MEHLLSGIIILPGMYIPYTHTYTEVWRLCVIGEEEKRCAPNAPSLLKCVFSPCNDRLCATSMRMCERRVQWFIGCFARQKCIAHSFYIIVALAADWTTRLYSERGATELTRCVVPFCEDSSIV